MKKGRGKRLKIGVDIDGVLIESDTRAFLDFCQAELGWKIDYEGFKQTHSMRQATGQNSPQIIGDAFAKFLIDSEDAQKPIEGAHDALKKLGEVTDIFLITARTESLRPITENFLRSHLQDVRYREISMDNVENKARKVVSFGVDYYIDDSHREISLVLENTSVRTKVIPFPGFHGRPNWHHIRDERVHWLTAWEKVKNDTHIDRHPEIRKAAWEEIVQLILEPTTT